jgi:hypothetical protein
VYTNRWKKSDLPDLTNGLWRNASHRGLKSVLPEKQRNYLGANFRKVVMGQHFSSIHFP